MNLSFLKLDINIMNDTKIKLIRKMPDGDSIIILWIGLLCLGMKSGKPGVIEVGDGIPFTPETLSIELDIKLNTVKLGLKTFEQFKMVEIWENGQLFITNFDQHQELTKIEKAREVSKISSRKYRDKLKSDVTVTESDETEEEKNKKRIRKEEEEKKKRLKKIPPELKFVKEYCEERKNGIDPQSFIDHYETNGWMRGKNKIKCWKACIRTWEKNNNNNQGPKPTALQGRAYEEFKP